MGGDASKPIRKIDDASAGPPDESGARRRLAGLKRWFLLDADRNLVAGLLLVGSFATVLLVGRFAPGGVFLDTGVSPGSILVELMKSIVSVVVIVLSINQLVLSPGLGPVGDQRERFDQSVDLRAEVEALTGRSVSPSSPAAFLAVVLDAVADRAERIAERGARDDGVPERATEWGTTVHEEASTVAGLLADGQFGHFEAVSAALRFSISEKVRSLRAMERAAEEPPEAFEEMEELLELFTVAREYVKTVYIREEYVSLSEGLLYTGLPAVILTYCAAQLYAPDVFPGTVLGVENQLLFVSAAVTVALAPFVLLISYVLRLAPLSRSTLFVGPFDARRTDDERRESGVGTQSSE